MAFALLFLDIYLAGVDVANSTHHNFGFLMGEGQAVQNRTISGVIDVSLYGFHVAVFISGAGQVSIAEGEKGAVVGEVGGVAKVLFDSGAGHGFNFLSLKGLSPFHGLIIAQTGKIVNTF